MPMVVVQQPYRVVRGRSSRGAIAESLRSLRTSLVGVFWSSHNVHVLVSPELASDSPRLLKD